MSERDDYVIVAELRAEDLVDGGTRSAERKLERVERLGTRVGSSITRALGGALALLGGGALFERFTSSLIGMNAAMEQAEVGMATLFSAQTGLAAADALGVARREVAALREDAAAGAGELRNYLEGFQALLGPALGLGATTDQIRELNRNALTAGFALRGNEGLSQAPLDVAQALRGDVSESETPIVMQALSAAGITAEKFRQLRPAQRISTLNRAFGTFAEGASLMGRTWDAQMGTLKDNVSGLFRLLTRPLFDRWSDHLRDANTWLEENEEKLELIVTQWGQRMVQIWDTLISKASTYAGILAGAAVTPALPMVAAAGGRAYAAAGVAGASLGAALRDPLGIGKLVAGAMGQSTAGLTPGLFPTIGAGLSAIGSALASIAAPIAIAVSLFIGMKGAMAEFPAVLEFISGAWASLMLSLDQLAASFGLLGGRGSLLNLIGAALVGVLGGVVYALSFVVKVFATLTTVVATLGRVIGGFLQGIWNFANGVRDPFAVVREGLLEGMLQVEDIWTNWKPPELPDVDSLPEVGDDEDGKKLPPSRHVTNINGPINVKVVTENMDDPARVAVTMDSVFDRVRNSRRQARRGVGPVFSGA